MKFSNIYSVLSVFIFTLLCVNTFANNPNIISFNRSDYNAGNKNWSISEDDKGILYIGNDLGLLEFDGIEWMLYKTSKNELIRAVYAASNSLIFTGGYEEFGVWNRDISGKLQYHSLSSKLPAGSMHNDDIWRIWEKDRTIYFQSFNAIYIYDLEKVYKLPVKKNILLLNKVYNELWIQEMGGSLFRVNKNNYEKIPGSEIFSKTEVKSVLPSKDKKYIITTSTMGIYIYDGKTFQPWNTVDELKNSNINCGIYSKSGNYFFGTILSGIYELSPSGKIINHFDTDSYLNNNTVLSLYEDSSNNIWAGLDRGVSCIAYINGISCFTDPAGKIGAVYSAAIYNNKLFIGTNQGVYYIDQNELQSMNAIRKFRFIPQTEGQVWYLSVINNKLYCGHNQGIYIIDENLNTSYPYPIHTGVFTITRADSNHLLLGTYIGLMIVNMDTHQLEQVEGLTEPINKVENDHAGNIWLQHMNKGVYRGRTYDNLSRTPILEYIGTDTNDTIPYNLKMFKVGGRIAFLGNDKFYTYNDINGKIVSEPTLNKAFIGISNLKNVINISPDNFWIIGDKLIYNVKYNEQNANISSIIDIGYRNLSLVDNYENIVSLNDSLSLICLDKGFLLCSNFLTQKVEEVTEPYIKSIKISNSDNHIIYLDKENPKIKYSHNTISFQFAVHGAFSKNITFQYQLLGLSDGWKTMDKKDNSISFERLARGKYIFMLRTVDRYGKTSPEITYEFEVLPIWYQSNWALLIYILLVILLFASITKYIQYRYKKIHIKKLRIIEARRLSIMNEKLQQEVNEKNAELLTQTSSIIQRNETITGIKNEIEEFFRKQNNRTLQPLYQKISTALNNDLDAEEDWKMFLIKFEQKHTNFFKKLKESYPQLTPNDLKLCACLKLNLDSKEIASLMNISVRAVENNRSRLRKKLDIPQNQHLSDFFFQF